MLLLTTQQLGQLPADIGEDHSGNVLRVQVELRRTLDELANGLGDGVALVQSINAEAASFKHAIRRTQPELVPRTAEELRKADAAALEQAGQRGPSPSPQPTFGVSSLPAKRSHVEAIGSGTPPPRKRAKTSRSGDATVDTSPISLNLTDVHDKIEKCAADGRVRSLMSPQIHHSRAAAQRAIPSQARIDRELAEGMARSHRCRVCRGAPDREQGHPRRYRPTRRLV